MSNPDPIVDELKREGRGMFLDGLYLFLNWVKDSVAGAIYRKRAQDAAEVKAIVDEAMVADKGVLWADAKPPTVIVDMPAPSPAPAMPAPSPAPAMPASSPAPAMPAPKPTE